MTHEPGSSPSRNAVDLQRVGFSREESRIVPRKRFFPAENAKTFPPDKVVRTRRHLERRFISHTEDSEWKGRRMI